MNNSYCLFVNKEEIYKPATEEVHEVMIKEEAVVLAFPNFFYWIHGCCSQGSLWTISTNFGPLKGSLPCYQFPKKRKFHEGSLHDIENQIIPCNSTKTGKIKPTIQADLNTSPSQNNNFSLMGTLQSRYISDKGYFQHIFVFSEIQSVSSSICFGQLNVRNKDQLLSINDVDLTLMTHGEVTVYLNSQPIDTNENITMNYLRPSTENINEINFTLFQPLGHFIEERLLNSNNTGFIRWYLNEGEKQHLYVTKDGNLTLQANTSTAFVVKCSSHDLEKIRC